MCPRKNVLLAWFSITVRRWRKTISEGQQVAQEESSINTIDNNIAKIIRTGTRYFCRCFSILSHSIAFEALTPIYRNNSSFRSILKGLIPSRRGHAYEPCLLWRGNFYSHHLFPPVHSGQPAPPRVAPFMFTRGLELLPTTQGLRTEHTFCWLTQAHRPESRSQWGWISIFSLLLSVNILSQGTGPYQVHPLTAHCLIVKGQRGRSENAYRLPVKGWSDCGGVVWGDLLHGTQQSVRAENHWS